MHKLLRLVWICKHLNRKCSSPLETGKKGCQGKYMAKPVLLTVDDDPEVLRGVERDLRRRYAERYRVLRADSGATALAALRGLKKRGDSVALLLVDQRMPQMTGVEFLGQAMELFPDAKLVLLTAYADTDAAIHAINDARIHHYLLKPWDPPEEHLYPVLDDLLGDSIRTFVPAAFRRRAGARHALVTALLRDPRFPGTQPGALPVDRS